MMRKNLLGRLEYVKTNKDGVTFEVENVAPFCIVRLGTWARFAARLRMNDDDIFGDQIDTFPSFVRACAFLRDNLEMMC